MNFCRTIVLCQYGALGMDKLIWQQWHVIATMDTVVLIALFRCVPMEWCRHKSRRGTHRTNFCLHTRNEKDKYVLYIYACFLIVYGHFTISDVHFHVKCPGGTSNPCNGHGVCEASSGTCFCDCGYSGSACETKSCPCKVCFLLAYSPTLSNLA